MVNQDSKTEDNYEQLTNYLTSDLVAAVKFHDKTKLALSNIGGRKTSSGFRINLFS